MVKNLLSSVFALFCFAAPAQSCSSTELNGIVSALAEQITIAVSPALGVQLNASFELSPEVDVKFFPCLLTISVFNFDNQGMVAPSNLNAKIKNTSIYIGNQCKAQLKVLNQDLQLQNNQPSASTLNSATEFSAIQRI